MNLAVKERRYGCATCRAVFKTGFARCPLDGTALQELVDDPLAGSTFADRYVIEDCIGEGGMGRVYRARHQRVSRRFAIKILYGEHATDEKMRDRFAREAESASRLQHVNVISVVDFGETEQGLLYLVMDYVEGRELREVIATEAPFPSERTHDIVRQLCSGLQHAHDEGLVHRDFKSENVILTVKAGREVPRIVDFGIAVMAERLESERLTTEGLVVGTPAYMSPEHATGRGVDHRSDLFSLGVMMYEMLAGVLPFEGTPIAIARQNLAVEPPPVGTRVPGLTVDPRLEAIALRLMEKNVVDRFQSANEVIAELDAMGGAAAEGAAVAVGAAVDVAIEISPPDDAADASEPALAEDTDARVAGKEPRFAPLPYDHGDDAFGETDQIRKLTAPRWHIAAGIVMSLLAVWLLVWLLLGDDDTSGGRTAAAPTPDAAPAHIAAIDAGAPAEADTELAEETRTLVEDLVSDGDAEAETVTVAKVAPSSKSPRIRRPAATAVERAAPQEREPGELPTAAAVDKPISQSSLTKLYVQVGEAIETAARTHGESAVAPLRLRYKDIPFQDAVRKESMRAEVERDLRQLRARASQLGGN